MQRTSVTHIFILYLSIQGTVVGGRGAGEALELSFKLCRSKDQANGILDHCSFLMLQELSFWFMKLNYIFFDIDLSGQATHLVMLSQLSTIWETLCEISFIVFHYIVVICETTTNLINFNV
jgi:hypothetical protein